MEQGEGTVSSMVDGMLLVQPLAINDTVVVDSGLPHKVPILTRGLSHALQIFSTPLLMNT